MCSNERFREYLGASVKLQQIAVELKWASIDVSLKLFKEHSGAFQVVISQGSQGIPGDSRSDVSRVFQEFSKAHRGILGILRGVSSGLKNILRS